MMPPFFQRLFAPIAFPGILRVLAIFQTILYFILKFMGPAQGAAFRDRLALDFGKVLGGEVWRLLSFVLTPPSNPYTMTGLLFLFIAVSFLFFINDILESEWGVAGLNAFFYLGTLGSILAGIVIWLVEPENAGDIAYALPGALAAGFILAAGTVAPRTEILLYFIIPVRLSFLAILGGVYLLWASFKLFELNPLLALVPALCVANYLIWVLPGALKAVRRVQDTHERRSRFTKAKLPASHAFHACVECGATELSHPEREFRVTTDGDEHCDDCLSRKRGN